MIMKVVFTLTLIIAVIISASIGCLIIFDVITVDQGKDYIFKALSAIILLGASSAVIGLVTGDKNKHND